jgi:hypothetical protein
MLVGGLSALLFFVLFLIYKYDLSLFRGLFKHVRTHGKSDFTVGQLLLLMFINSIPLWFIAFGIIANSYDWRVLTAEESAGFALIVPFIFCTIVFLLYYAFRSKEIVPNEYTIDEEQNNAEQEVALTESLNKENAINNSLPRFCKYCGKEIDVDSDFCKHCGKPTYNKEFLKREKQNCVSKSKKEKIRKNPLPKRISNSTGIIIASSIIILFISLFVYFWGLGFLEYERTETPYNIIIACAIITVVFIAMYFGVYASLTKKFNPFLNVIRKLYLIVIVACVIASAISSIDIICSGQPKELYFLAKKLHSDDKESLNDAITETYNLMIDNFGYEEIHHIMSGKNLPYGYGHIFTYLDNAILAEIHKDNPLAQGIYGEMCLFANNEYQSDSWKEGALENLKKAANKNDARALLRLGDCYANKFSIPDFNTDLKLANDYWVKALSIAKKENDVNIINLAEERLNTSK